MHLIESLFHLYPDNGNGATELGIVVVVFAGWLLAKATRWFAKAQVRAEQATTLSGVLSYQRD